MRVLVIGATGGVGGSIVEQLLALPSPPSIRVSSRDPSKVTLPTSVEVVRGDLRDTSTYPTLFASVDRVFLYCPHGQGSDTTAELMRAMQGAGVRYVVFLSSKWVVDAPESVFARVHAPMEEAIRGAGFSYTLLRPGSFSSNVFMHWMGEVRATGGLTLVRPNAQQASIAPEDIAAVAVTALTTDGLVDTAPSLTGPRSMSQGEQVEVVSRARESMGKASIRLQVKSAEEWRARAVQHMPAVFADELLRFWGVMDGKPEEVLSSERLTGKPSTTFEAWVEKNKQALGQ